METQVRGQFASGRQKGLILNIVFFLAKFNEKLFFRHIDYDQQYNCDFCSTRFDNRNERNVHILTHFLQRNCENCDKSLLRIGDEWYELHLATNCTEIKCESVYVNSVVECELEETNLDYGNDIKTENYGYPIDLEENIEDDDRESGVPNNFLVENINERENVYGNKDELQYYTVEKPPTQLTIHTNDELFTCTICNDKFKNEKYLKCHMDRMHKYKCTFAGGCNGAFRTQSILKIHMDSHKKAIKKHVCERCGQNYALASSLYNHIQSHKTVKCIPCNRRLFSETELDYHNHVHIFQTFTCDICQRTFEKLSDLRNHVHTTHIKQFHCTFSGCDTQFRDRSQYSDHIASKHKQIKNYQCELCGKSYCTRSTHKYSVHRIFTKKHPCTVCGKVFPENKILKKHLETHK